MTQVGLLRDLATKEGFNGDVEATSTREEWSDHGASPPFIARSAVTSTRARSSSSRRRAASVFRPSIWTHDAAMLVGT